MRKLAILGLILFTIGVIIITLGITNYGGVGTWLGDLVHGSILQPARNFIVDKWLIIGTSGWYILATALGISIIGGLFMVFIAYGLFWQKLIQQKILHKTITSTHIDTIKQPAPAPTPMPLVQNEPPKKEDLQEAE